MTSTGDPTDGLQAKKLPENNKCLSFKIQRFLGIGALTLKSGMGVLLR